MDQHSSCYTLQPAGTLGNARQNQLFGPRLINLDFALLKNTKITERLQAQFRAEFFNIANSTDFMPPNGSLFTGVLAGRVRASSLRPRCWRSRWRFARGTHFRLYRRYGPEHSARDSVRPEIDLLIGRVRSRSTEVDFEFRDQLGRGRISRAGFHSAS